MRLLMALRLALLLSLGTPLFGVRWSGRPPFQASKMPIVVFRDAPTARSLASLSASLSESPLSAASCAPSPEANPVDETISDNSELNSKNVAQPLSDESDVRGGNSTVVSVTAGTDSAVTETAEDEIRSRATTVEDDNNDKEMTPNTDFSVVAESIASDASATGHDKIVGAEKPKLDKMEETHIDGQEKKGLHFRRKKKAKTSAARYAKKLKNRNHLNISRKITHAGFGLFFAALNQAIPRERFLPGMTILTTATLIMELLRYRRGFGWMNDALHFVLGSSLRKHEMEGKFTGSFYYFFGVTMTSWLFPKTAATMGMCQLALADPSASYFGRRTRHVYWSRIESGLGGFGRNKGILGFLGGALFCFPFNYRVLSIAKFSPEGIPGGNKHLVFASLALGFAGAFADLAVPTPALTMPKRVCGVKVPPFHVDDNFVVPIVSGYACTKIFSSLGWPQSLELAKYIIF